MLRRRGPSRLLAGILLTAALALPSVAAHADTDLGRSYPGPTYADGLRTEPTRYEHQSKLWFHDDSWWALMVEPTSLNVRIHELLPNHTWRPTPTVVDASPADTGDALSEGDQLYVVSRRADDVLQLARLTYDRDKREYEADPPVVITDRGSSAPASITKDSTGRLWTAFATNNEVFVTYSDNAINWAELFALPVPDASFSGKEVAAVVAFNRSVGVIWSDQADGAFRFAVHSDGAPVNEWRPETALPGPGLVDNHISIKVAHGDGEGGDRLIAAVKTSQGDKDEPPDSPLALVLLRTPDGVWSNVPAGTVADSHNSPIIEVDETNRTVYFLADTDGIIHMKSSALDPLSFGPGRGAPFVRSSGLLVSDVTGSKQPLNPRTGMVAMASSAISRTYVHAELALPGTPPPPARPDTQPPSAPGELWAEAGGPDAVGLYWSAADDGDRWVAAADRAPVREYVVRRDGTEIGRTSGLSFADAPPAAGRTYTYTVRAVDDSGNSSSEPTVSITVPQTDQRSTTLLWGGALGLGALVMAAVALLRWRRTR